VISIAILTNQTSNDFNMAYLCFLASNDCCDSIAVIVWTFGGIFKRIATFCVEVFNFDMR